jgi:DNA-binding CsgD family transcriptional regulator
MTGLLTGVPSGVFCAEPAEASGVHCYRPSEGSPMTADQPERRWPADRSPIHDTPGGVLYGRDHEIGVLDDLIRRPGSGTGGVLVIRGEAGIGKSALVAAARARGRRLGMRVLAATGVESEARIPFAGLHQLLRPVLSLADGLPTRQRGALLAAFGMGDETSGELFLIGLATLELVSDTAARSPLLLVAEDAQWLDDASCAVLAFVARRLAAEPAAMLIAVRDGFGTAVDDAGLAELRLQGLPPEAAAALLDAHAPGLAPGPRERVLAEAAGNPLALVELPAALRSVDLDSGVLPPSRLRLTARLERAFAAQQSGLPTASRSLLLVAAADDGDVPAEMFSAAAILEGTEVTVDALGPAVTARLLEFDGFRVRFRHPLARSAIYQAASPARRHAAHAALAGVLAGQPDRQVWHRAARVLRRPGRTDADGRAGRRGHGIPAWASFDALAFADLAETARSELRASGEASRRRTPEAWDQLTPQELQIGRAAAAGLSNREIGEQLYISHRTVGYHMHRIFAKLGITSRSQLHIVLPAPAAT